MTEMHEIGNLLVPEIRAIFPGKWQSAYGSLKYKCFLYSAVGLDFVFQFPTNTIQAPLAIVIMPSTTPVESRQWNFLFSIRCLVPRAPNTGG
jgi:hypothetical protein